MRTKFASLIGGLAIVVALANMFVAPWSSPFGKGYLHFNIANGIEYDGWTKAGLPIVLHNHFVEAQIVDGGYRGPVGLKYEGIVAGIYNVNPIDQSSPWIEAQGTSLVANYEKNIMWSGTNFCYGEGSRRCKLNIMWLPEEEQTKVTFHLVHMGKRYWAVVSQGVVDL